MNAIQFPRAAGAAYSPDLELRLGDMTVRGTSVAARATAFAVPTLGVALDVGRMSPTMAEQPVVLLSHGHLDHLSGVLAYLNVRARFHAGEPTRLVAPEPVAAALRQALAVMPGMATWSCFQYPSSTSVLLSDEELARRRAEQDGLGWKPALPRKRRVPLLLFPHNDLSRCSGVFTNWMQEQRPDALITFDLVLSGKFSMDETLSLIARQGYQRLLIQGAIVPLEEAAGRLKGLGAPRLTVIQDRVKLTAANRARVVVKHVHVQTQKVAHFPRLFHESRLVLEQWQYGDFDGCDARMKF